MPEAFLRHDLLPLVGLPAGRIVQELEARGLLDDAARGVLDRIVKRRGDLHFDPHEHKEAPMSPHWTGAVMAWQRHGTVYVFSLEGEMRDGMLHPATLPIHVLAWCAIAAGR